MLGIRLSPSVSVKIELINRGATESVFPAVEQWLVESSEHQDALEHISDPKDTERYKSIIDFIFVEQNPSYKPAIQAYYERKGPSLSEIIMGKRRRYYEAQMLTLLEVALAAFRQKQTLSWADALAVVESLAVQTAFTSQIRTEA